MSLEANKALVRRFYQEIDAGNVDAMDELVAEDYIDHSPPPFPGLAPGREGLKQAFRMFWDATPGRHVIGISSRKATGSSPDSPRTAGTPATCRGYRRPGTN